MWFKISNYRFEGYTICYGFTGIYVHLETNDEMEIFKMNRLNGFTTYLEEIGLSMRFNVKLDTGIWWIAKINKILKWSMC